MPTETKQTKIIIVDEKRCSVLCPWLSLFDNDCDCELYKHTLARDLENVYRTGDCMKDDKQ